MKDQILKIAKVKNEKEFYKKYPTEEAFMAKHGAAFKKAAMGKSMVYKQLNQLTDWDGAPEAQLGYQAPLKTYDRISPRPAVSSMEAQLNNPAFQQQHINDIQAMASKSGAGFDTGAAGMGLLNNAGQIIGGIEKIQQQKQNIKKQEGAAKISGLVSQAAGTRERVQQKYVRPEDYLMQPGQMGSPTGVGTSYLQDGGTIGGNPTEIQNIYNPGDIYTDGGYEPIESQNIKQFKKGGYLAKAEFGDYFQDSGQAEIGSAAGEAIGNAIMPGVGGEVGKLLGKVAGNLLGGAADANKMARLKEQTETNQAQAAFQQNMQGQFSKNLEYGGSADKEHAWVSNGWQPQVITKFGEYNVKDLLKPPHDADMLRAGGHLKEYTPPSAEAMFTGRPPLEPLTMDNGGRMTSTNMMFDTDKYPRANDGVQMAMGGDLQVGDGGHLETLSYNPNLPGGEIGMFRGASHDNGGIQTQYGDNQVEVEGGEPAVKLQDGGSSDNLVVFGNMKINKNIADLMGDSKAKGKKFKSYIADIAKNDAKQNKRVGKALDLIDMSDGNSVYDQLAMNTGQATLMGANAWQKINAEKIKQAGIVQDAIHQTAKQLGAKSDRLAEGKIERETDPSMVAKGGIKLKKAQRGWHADWEDYAGDNTVDETGGYLENSPVGKTLPVFDQPESFGSKVWDVTKNIGKAFGKGASKYSPAILSNLSPWLRPSNAREPLPVDQTYPEMFALATNQLEPVQAQTYRPMLDTPYDISLQDQVNAIDSQSRAAIRAAGNNPAAQAAIMSQAIEAKNRVLGEQTRINQANKMQVYEKNRALLNDAQLKNLQILDNQYVRQAQAKSATKEQTLAALSSIAAKTAQQRALNRKMAVLENMYGYRFSPSGVIYNVNDPYFFDTSGGFSSGQSLLDTDSKEKQLSERTLSRDKYGNITGSKEKSRTTTGRNGAIVNALKNL